MTTSFKPLNDYNRGHLLGGIVIIIAGILFLLQNLGDLYMPAWLTSWPMVFILVGLYVNARKRFQSGFGYVMMILGAVNLPGYIFPTVDLSNLFFPILLIIGGAYLILRRINTVVIPVQ